MHVASWEFISLHIWQQGMVEAVLALQNAIQRFLFDRFDAGSDEWEYYIQRFETELALHNLLAGDHAADACQNLLLSKIGPDAFKILVDHFCPAAVNTKTYQHAIKGNTTQTF